MVTKELEKVIITKPLTLEEIKEFKKFYIKGIIHFDNRHTIISKKFEYTAEHIAAPMDDDDYWALDGFNTEEVIEDGEIVETSHERYARNPLYRGGANTTSSNLQYDIKNLLKHDGGTIIGYKYPKKMKGHRTRAPAKKRTPAVRVNVRKMF